MGDRANVKVVDGDSTVYLYTHWSGAELPVILQNALRRGESRWTDGAYLARIIFNEMVAGDELNTTGFGISSVIGDGDDRILTVDIERQSVKTNDKRETSFKLYAALAYIPTWTVK